MRVCATTAGKHGKVKNGQHFIYVAAMLWQCLAVLEATEKRAVHKFQFDDDDEKRIEEVEKALARAGFARYALGKYNETERDPRAH